MIEFELLFPPSPLLVFMATTERKQTCRASLYVLTKLFCLPKMSGVHTVLLYVKQLIDIAMVVFVFCFMDFLLIHTDQKPIYAH